MSAGPPGAAGWQRLDARMIWVDALQSGLSLAPAALAVTVFEVEPTPQNLWPVLLLAGWGLLSAGNDALRWVKTRYRVTDEYVERRTGLLVREYRSIRRERIRSVDTTAKLRHRLAGLRVVTIGAGQQRATGESALSLDAVSREVAAQLQRNLLDGRRAALDAATAPEAPAVPAPVDPVLARLRWSWIWYNLFNIWAYVAAAGLLWGATWLGGSLGLDPVGFVLGLLDWRSLGWAWSLAIGVVAVGALGVAVLAVSFVTEHWNFRLSRVATGQGTVLRTAQGLFSTRQVDRDERRVRGVAISEPVLWRWLGVADTNVISTGLADSSLSPASTILPRGPARVARSVAAAVLGAIPDPFAVRLRRHPPSALRRRCWWAALGCAGFTAVGAVLSAAVPAVPGWAPLVGPALLPVGLVAAVVAYRALGHAACGDYLVVRSGLLSRTTAALQARAVIGWHLRQSVLQRRLGLVSLAAATAAGDGYYQAPDLAAADALELAERAVPDLLTPFLEPAKPAQSREELTVGDR